MEDKEMGIVERFSINDLIVPLLAEQGRLRGNNTEPSCPIRVEVRNDDVRLWVGPRDWQWDRRTGALIGAGTCFAGDHSSEGISATEG